MRYGDLQGAADPAAQRVLTPQRILCRAGAPDLADGMIGVAKKEAPVTGASAMRPAGGRFSPVQPCCQAAFARFISLAFASR